MDISLLGFISEIVSVLLLVFILFGSIILEPGSSYVKKVWGEEVPKKIQTKTDFLFESGILIATWLLSFGLTVVIFYGFVSEGYVSIEKALSAQKFNVVICLCILVIVLTLLLTYKKHFRARSGVLINVHAIACTTTVAACIAVGFGTVLVDYTNSTGATGATNETSVSESSTGETEIVMDEVPEMPDYDVSEYVTLCDFSKVTLQAERYEVSEDDVENTIQQILSQNASYETTEKDIVEAGDCVNVSYAIVTDGEVDENTRVENVHFDLADESIAGDALCAQVIGKNVGSTEVYTVNYGSEDSDAIEYSLTINSIDEKVIPDLTDDFVQQVSQESKTVDEWRAEVHSAMEESYAEAEAESIRDALQDAALEQCTIASLPDGLVEVRLAEYVNGDKKSAQGVGFSFDEYLTEYYGFESEEEYREELRAYVEDTCKCELILEAVRAENDIELSDEDFAEFCEEAYPNYNFESVEEFVEYYGEDEVKAAALNEKTWKFLEGLVKIEY